MDPRLPALVALALFAALTWGAGAVADPDAEAGTGSLVLAVAGYAAVLLAGALLLTRPTGARGRRSGALLLVAGAGMAAVHLAVALSDAADANIGAGLLLLLFVAVVAVVAIRLVAGLLLDRRTRVGS